MSVKMPGINCYPCLSLVLLAATALPGAAAAQTESVIYNFNGTTAANPAAGLLVDAHGNLFGTTIGIANGAEDAVAFQLSPPATAGGAWSETLLAAMGTKTKTGISVASLTAGPNGALYGVGLKNKEPKPESCPNIGGCGAVFDFKPPKESGSSWKVGVVHKFVDGTGADVIPAGPLLLGQGGIFYGTVYGGANGQGSIYALTPPHTGVSSWTYADIYDFNCIGTECGNGNMPFSNLVQDSSGALYGITGDSGAACPQEASGCGTVFQLTQGVAGSWTETVIYQFTGDANGALPQAGLTIDPAGNLYGTTSEGGNLACPVYAPGSGCGTAFELSPNGAGGWNFTTLYAFGGTAGNDAAFPGVTLIRDATGALYGTSYAGGSASAGCAQGPYEVGCGTVFKLTNGTSGWAETVLHSFTAGGTSTDVYLPSAPVALGNDGTTLYGVATNGVFQITQ
jgi:uncharacterized protein YceK